MNNFTAWDYRFSLEVCVPVRGNLKHVRQRNELDVHRRQRMQLPSGSCKPHHCKTQTETGTLGVMISEWWLENLVKTVYALVSIGQELHQKTPKPHKQTAVTNGNQNQQQEHMFYFTFKS